MRTIMKKTKMINEEMKKIGDYDYDGGHDCVKSPSLFHNVLNKSFLMYEQ